MSITLRIDNPGGANFEGYELRNVGRLSVGQTALPDAGLEFQVAGDGKVNGNLEVATLLEAAGIGTALTEIIVDLIAASLTSTGATVAITYDDATGLINLEIGAAAVPAVGVSLYQTANQTILHATNTLVTGWTERYDTDGFYDPASPARITVPAGYAGKYRVNAAVLLQRSGGTGPLAQMHIRKNGSASISDGIRVDALCSASYEVTVAAADEIELAVGDYLELYFRHEAGGAGLILYGAAESYSRFNLTYIGP